MPDLDTDLLDGLKRAKSKKMFFAFIPKGADGKLIVSMKKIPAKEIAEAKKEIGGGTPVTGKCIGPVNNLVFYTAKQAAPTVAAAVKKVVKRDAGLTVVPDFQVAADADAEETQDTGAAAAGAAAPPAGAAAAGAAAPPAAPAAPPPPAGQARVLGIQKALQKLGYDPGKIDGIMGPHTHAAVKKFQHASGLAADGVVGPKTQAALAKALAGGAAPPGGTPASPPAPAPAAHKAAPAGHANVAGIQKALQKLGYDPGKIDGIMGSHTHAAIKKFQHANGLKVDGIVGPKTQAALAKALGGGGPTPPADGPKLVAWETACKNAISGLKGLALKIAGTKQPEAKNVLVEINSLVAMVKKLPPKPAPHDIPKLDALIRKDESLIAAEECPPAFYRLDVRQPLLDALESLS